ncbi:DeoR/GlpR transcriptional regulator [Terriglobus albidus]|uniref:DeoR/GlpR transcriptional regulator n=1 Tax=Terriglobus albidus TaxID=1592106 RepID=A0A5B9EI20_9BACT|nr:DeoR/GlpR family DNA-binding transcription regulator [Terriglobus albidus]QEE29726.1 DeoR/GlpR transcriptional regulator [Terriglobus albidus]
MSTKTEERAERIMKLLLRNGDISVEELVATVGTSAPSIRRDLTRLEKRGLIRRTHGGATLVEPLLYEPFRYDISFQSREGRFAEEKRRIGLAAADLIQENETIGLNAGTTTTQIGRALRHRRNISVVTNAINIGMELCNQPGIKTSLTGGLLAWAWAFSLSGQATLDFLNTVYMDKVFLGVTGVDLERGATTREQEEALVFRAMARQAKQVIVVADSSKFGNVSPAFVSPLEDIDILITDTGLSESVAAAYAAKDIRVLRV